MPGRGREWGEEKTEEISSLPFPTFQNSVLQITNDGTGSILIRVPSPNKFGEPLQSPPACISSQHFTQLINNVKTLRSPAVKNKLIGPLLSLCTYLTFHRTLSGKDSHKLISTATWKVPTLTSAPRTESSLIEQSITTHFPCSPVSITHAPVKPPA